MGARVYLPATARFLQTDPIDGGTPNDYVYPPDPVNGNDYTGLASSISLGSVSGGWCLQSCGNVAKHIQPAASVPYNYRGPIHVSPYRPSVRINVPKPAAPSAPVKTRTTVPQLKHIHPVLGDLSKLPKTGPVIPPPRPESKPGGWDRVDHALNTGRSHAETWEYGGYAAGCTAGAGAAVYGSALSFGGTLLLAGVGCAGAAEVGSKVGYGLGGLIGIGVGLFTY